jgi:hypothetical protein
MVMYALQSAAHWVAEPGGKGSGGKYDPKGIGERSEAMVIAALLREGIPVAAPFGDNQRYDLLVDRGDRVLKVQVKTGRLVGGVIVVPTCSSSAHRGGPRRSYRGECDLFAIYCPQLDRIYWVPVDACGLRRMYLRVNPPSGRTRRHKWIRWASDYERFPDGV